MRQAVSLHPLHTDDFPRLKTLWEAAGWIEVRQTDTPEALSGFLNRNPTSNYAAYDGTLLVGAVLAGHDGWRGYLYHMAVRPEYRAKGVGARLVHAAVSAIKREGIPKVHCLVKRDNLVAMQFWEACGFELRDELYDFSL